MRRQSVGSPYSFSAIVASVSPSPTTYVSPAAAGDGLGEGLGDGDESGGGATGLLSGDGLAVATTGANVGVGGLPPIQPQAVSSTVPTISPWTVQRGVGITSLQFMLTLQYGFD